MAELSYLVSALVMGLFLVAVVAFVRRSERDAVRPERETRSTPESLLDRTRESTSAWIAGFLVLVLVAGGLSVAYVGGLSPVPTSLARTAGLVLAAVLGAALAAYLGWGGYHVARSRGFGDAQAAAVGAWMLGLLFVVAIAARLLTAQ